MMDEPIHFLGLVVWDVRKPYRTSIVDGDCRVGALASVGTELWLLVHGGEASHEAIRGWGDLVLFLPLFEVLHTQSLAAF